MNNTNRRYIVTLAAVAGGILVIGTLLRPGQQALDDPLTGASQAELGRLASLSQRRSVDTMAEYFAAVAGSLEAHVVNLPGLDRSGIVWEADLVLTSRTEPRFPDDAIVTTPDGDVGVAVVAAGVDLPVAALRVSPIVGLTPPRREVTPATVARRVDHRDVVARQAGQLYAGALLRDGAGALRGPDGRRGAHKTSPGPAR